MRPRFLPLTTLALIALATPARAEPIAARLARLFDPGPTHPLVDRTGRIPLTVTLPSGVDAASLGLLPVAPGIGAVYLAPAEIAPFITAHPGIHVEAGPPRRALLDVSKTWTQVDTFRQATGATGAGVVVGLVDTGIDIRHPDFRTRTGRTRIAWALVKGPPAGLHADLEETFGCTDPKQTPCAVFSAEDIDEMIAGGGDAIVDVEGHGTHVASIAAGNGGVFDQSRQRFVGLAPEATLIVAAPGAAGEGFSDPQILNGARFVMDRADAMKMPVVCNLSLGGDFGPHDGTSALEKGLSAFVGDDKPGHAVVVAAGNSGALYQLAAGTGYGGTHTEVSVSPGETARVPILATAAQNAQAFVWITFRPGDDAEVALEGPGGARWIGFTGKGSDAGYSAGSGMSQIQAGVVNDAPADSVAISSDTNSATVVFTGHWVNDAEFAVLLRGSALAELWVTGTGDAVSPGSLLFERALKQGTINIPASAPALLAVGCTLNRTTWKPLGGPTIAIGTFGADTDPIPDGSCYFSAVGPTPAGVQKPEISAPGAFVAAAMAADADPRTNPGGLFDIGGCPPEAEFCAVVDDHHAIAQGTSMSAPHVAGAVALLFQLDPTLTQGEATEILEAGVRRPSGHVPDANQLGPGELDLIGAQQAMGSATEAGDPDLAKSWYTLSSQYARPDPTWPVWGTVELRRPDGALAGAIDEGKLALDLTGGTVIQGLTLVRQGMWRFAVAGTPADLGSNITVDVSYRGASLGQRTLPVGNDVWSAMDTSLDATSGACACEAAGAPRGWLAGALVGLTAVGLSVARRKRRAG